MSVITLLTNHDSGPLAPSPGGSDRFRSARNGEGFFDQIQ